MSDTALNRPGTTAATTEVGPALLQMVGIVKVFPGVRALSGVDLDVRAGEVHCLLGQNGAGKSTLIKVLAGVHRPEEGEISWAGQPVRFHSPVAAMRTGVATIYQKLDLVEGLTVAENIFLGHELATLGVSRRGSAVEQAAALLRRLGHPEISPRRELARLSAAQRQIVSMARALSHDARLIVMDEPSAVLDQEEVKNLFAVIRELRAAGVSVVYISHRLDEVRQIGDRVTILKDGRTVARNLPASTTPTAQLITHMTGRSIEYVFPQRRPTHGTSPTGAGDDVLRVEGLTRAGEFRDICFQVRAGEVLGLAGLVGAGRSEVMETVYGARRADAGTVQVLGHPLRNGSVRAAIRAGIGLCPEERKSQALLLDQSVAQNISLSSLTRVARAGVVNRRVERDAAQEQATSLDIRPPTVTQAVRALSGGNQQKVVLGRWLLHGCRVLLLDEPTRGVDVGARAELYRLIRALADDGVALVVVSSEIEELLGLSDRVVVLREGAVVFTGAAAELDEARVLDLVMATSAPEEPANARTGPPVEGIAP